MRYFLLILSLFLCSLLYSQSRTKTKLTYGFSLNPTLTYSINSSTSTNLYSGNKLQTIEEFVDSVSDYETYKLSLGATVWANYMLGQKWTIQVGLGYSEVGFVREQMGIKYKDNLFPGIGTNGRVEDNTNIVKNAYYHFKYQYLTVPVLFNYYAKRSDNFKWAYYLSGGVGMNVLLKHQMKAKLDNFYVDGENVFKLDSTGYEGAPFTVNLFVGGRFEYKIDKQLSAFVQPMLTIFPMSVSKTEVKVHPVGVQLNIGVAYSLNRGD